MAQLVAHHTGSVGVRGSNPLSSTEENPLRPLAKAGFFVCGRLSHALSVAVLAAMPTACIRKISVCRSLPPHSGSRRAGHQWLTGLATAPAHHVQRDGDVDAGLGQRRGAAVRRRGPAGAAACCGGCRAVRRRARRCTARRRTPAPCPVIRRLADSKSPSVRLTKSAARSASAVTSATSWMSVNSATRCGECSRAIICWVVIASKWLRRNPSMPSAVDPIATRMSGSPRPMRWSAASVHTVDVPGTHTHRVAVLASTLNGRAPAACPNASAAPSSRARSPAGSSLQMTAAVWAPVSA